MYLCEEYLKRHGIKIPYVKHVNSGCAFYQIEGESRWRLLTINWKEPSWHPGSYYVRIYRPVHDGYKNNNLFDQMQERKLFWEQYEDWFLDWREDVVRVAKGPEVRLTAWEICLFCYDSLLANYVSHNDFLSTVDPELTVAQRLSALDKLITYFKEHFPFFIEAWQMDVRRYTEGYTHWLADLISK